MEGYWLLLLAIPAWIIRASNYVFAGLYNLMFHLITDRIGVLAAAYFWSPLRCPAHELQT
jgi:hypothetical protein